jgi:hypothetical protein
MWRKVLWAAAPLNTYGERAGQFNPCRPAADDRKSEPPPLDLGIHGSTPAGDAGGG